MAGRKIKGQERENKGGQVEGGGVMTERQNKKELKKVEKKQRESDGGLSLRGWGRDGDELEL